MVYGRGLDDARPSLTSSCDVVSAGSGPEAQSPWPTAPAEAEARGGRCRHDRRHVFGSCQRRAHATCGPDDPIGRVEPPYVTDQQRQAQRSHGAPAGNAHGHERRAVEEAGGAAGVGSRPQ